MDSSGGAWYRMSKSARPPNSSPTVASGLSSIQRSCAAPVLQLSQTRFAIRSSSIEPKPLSIGVEMRISDSPEGVGREEACSGDDDARHLAVVLGVDVGKRPRPRLPPLALALATLPLPLEALPRIHERAVIDPVLHQPESKAEGAAGHDAIVEQVLGGCW